MNYEEALGYIHGTYTFGIKLGLENITILLNYMGNPHKKLKFIHLAGTNGKGSTSNMISNVLKHSGYKVGLYISPYLEEFTERIQINGNQISKESLSKITEKVKNSTDKMISAGHPHPSEFEIVTAIGFQYFYEEEVDIVVLEVGMGGRFDATNVIDNSLLSIITSIGMDHTQYLGETLEEIAFEKAGIIKEKGNVVLYPQSKVVTDEIIKVCKKRDATLYSPSFEKIEVQKSSLTGQKLNYLGGEIFESFSFDLSLLGEHQANNCSTALKALEILLKLGYNISVPAIKKGMSTIKFPGRFEILNINPTIIIDGAHNENGIDSLVKTVKTYVGKKVKLILGVLGDKDFAPMIRKLIPICDMIYTVTPNNPRAMDSKDLSLFIQTNHPDVKVKSLDTIKEGAFIATQDIKDEVYIFVGSLYMIGDARTHLVKYLENNE
ncbi:MAG: bifunctional folylpolyglutamate synthase/dihydrofolate synthase [Eubacteriaceae bacterium]